MRNNAEGSRKTSQGSFELSCRNRTYLDMKYEQHSSHADYANRDCRLHPQNSAQNRLIVPHEIR